MLEAWTWKSMRDSRLFIVNACNWGREIPQVFKNSLNFKSVGKFPLYIRGSNHLSYLMGTGHKIWQDNRPHVEMPDCVYHERAITCDRIVICSEIWEIGESAPVNYGATWTPVFNGEVKMLDVFPSEILLMFIVKGRAAAAKGGIDVHWKLKAPEFHICSLVAALYLRPARRHINWFRQLFSFS